MWSAQSLFKISLTSVNAYLMIEFPLKLPYEHLVKIYATPF